MHAGKRYAKNLYETPVRVRLHSLHEETRDYLMKCFCIEILKNN